MTDDLRGVPAVEFIAAEYGITPDQVRRTTTDDPREAEAAGETCCAGLCVADECLCDPRFCDREDS